MKSVIKRYPQGFFLLSVVIVYAFGLGGDFIIDDRTFLVDNDLLPQIRLRDIHLFLLQPSNYWGEHLPLRDIFLAIQYCFFGENPFGYHLVSLSLYLLILAICWRLLDSLFDKCYPDMRNRPEGSLLLVAILSFFAFHPVHVESVVYISGQKDLLCVLFSLLAVGTACAILKRGQASVSSCLLLSLCYYAAFLSKNLAVATGLFISVSGFAFFRENPFHNRRWLPAWGVLNIPVLLWLVYSMRLADSYWGDMNRVSQFGFPEHLLNSFRILGGHFKLALFPYPLSFGYPFSSYAGVDVYFLLGIVVSALLVLLFFINKNILTRVAILLVLCYLLPSSQLFATFQNAGLYDRYLFVPVLGFALLFGDVLMSLPGKWLSGQVVKVGAAITVIPLVMLTFAYIPTYRDNVAVFENSHEKFPSWNVASFNYLYSLIEAGELELAEDQLMRDINLQSPIWVHNYFAGWVLFEKGRPEEAISPLRRSYLESLKGGYYPFAGIPLAKALIATGDRLLASQVLNTVLKSPIRNPLEFYKAKRILEQIDR